MSNLVQWKSVIRQLTLLTALVKYLAIELDCSFLFSEVNTVYGCKYGGAAIKLKLIKQTTQDPDPSSMKREFARADQVSYKLRFGTFTTFLLEVVPLIVLLVVPFSVQAGFLTAILGALNEESAVAVVESVDHSAQNTPLLSANLNPDPKAVGGGDVYVEEGALVSTGPVGEDEIATSPYRNGEISVYTVQAGDTISQIAEMYGVTSNTIRWANSLSGSIQPGDVLVILPIVGVKHEVEKGETLNSIVKKYEGDLDEVLKYNGLAATDDIAVGDTVIIPGGAIATPKYVAAAPTKTSGRSSTGYVHPAPGSIKTQGIHGYNAVDLASSYGSPIRAAAAGEVIVSKSGGWNGGYGNYIVIKHNDGTQTLYAHLSKNYVGVGDWVGAAETIGAMGSTGRSTGTHLHFEVRGARNPF